MQVSLKVLCYFSNQTTKRQFSYEQFCRFLVPTNFSQCYSSRTVSHQFLDATCIQMLRILSTSLESAPNWFLGSENCNLLPQHFCWQILSWLFPHQVVFLRVLPRCPFSFHYSLTEINRILGVLYFVPGFINRDKSFPLDLDTIACLDVKDWGFSGNGTSIMILSGSCLIGPRLVDGVLGMLDWGCGWEL